MHGRPSLLVFRERKTCFFWWSSPHTRPFSVALWLELCLSRLFPPKLVDHLLSSLLSLSFSFFNGDCVSRNAHRSTGRSCTFLPHHLLFRCRFMTSSVSFSSENNNPDRPGCPAQSPTVVMSFFCASDSSFCLPFPSLLYSKSRHPIPNDSARCGTTPPAST